VWRKFHSLNHITEIAVISQSVLGRPELALLKRQGYQFDHDSDVVTLFEQKVADFAGSPYAVAVDSCSHGLFLCMKYLGVTGPVTVPRRTYVSVPMQVVHAGAQVKFVDHAWQGSYRLDPWPITDAAMLWHPSMYTEGMFVISFQIKKRICIGRGGMILLDDTGAYDWLCRARHDGRTPGRPHAGDNITHMGWHYYMTPEDAARGILLMDAVGHVPAQSDHTCYSDISTMPLFHQS